jgi:hypothetical protein
MNINLDVPESLKDIKLDAFIRINTYLADNNDKIEPLMLVKLYYDYDDEIVTAIPYIDIIKLNTAIITALNDVNIYELKRIIKLNGNTYGFIPNFEDINYGDYLTLLEYIVKFDTYPNAFAILYRKVSKKKRKLYDIVPYDYDNINLDDINSITMDIVTAALSFFLYLSEKLKVHM